MGLNEDRIYEQKWLKKELWLSKENIYLIKGVKYKSSQVTTLEATTHTFLDVVLVISLHTETYKSVIIYVVLSLSYRIR